LPRQPARAARISALRPSVGAPPGVNWVAEAGAENVADAVGVQLRMYSRRLAALGFGGPANALCRTA
jgi:hypothetical protein